MRKNLYLLIVGLSLAGCDKILEHNEPAFKGCKAQLLDKLRSPSSFKLISTEVTTRAISRDDYLELHSASSPQMLELLKELAKQPGIYSVAITYDAQNAFGATIRETELCEFPIENLNKPPSQSDIKHLMLLYRLKKSSHSEEATACCLSVKKQRASVPE